MTTTQTNPGRPPKHWMRRCIKGVTAGKSAADPGAVCGSLWHHKLSEGQRRAILKEERAGGGLVENPRHSYIVVRAGSTSGPFIVVRAEANVLQWTKAHHLGLYSTKRGAEQVAREANKRLAEGENYFEIRGGDFAENPIGTGGVLLAVGAVLGVGAIIYLATREKKEGEKPATSFTKPGGKPVLPPPPPLAPPCVVDAGKFQVFAQSKGMLAVYLPACPPTTSPVQNQPPPPYTPCWDGPEPPTWTALWMSVMLMEAPTVPVLLVLKDGTFWTYGGSPPTYSKRDDLRAEYCAFAAGQFTPAIQYQFAQGDPASLFIL